VNSYYAQFEPGSETVELPAEMPVDALLEAVETAEDIAPEVEEVAAKNGGEWVDESASAKSANGAEAAESSQESGPHSGHDVAGNASEAKKEFDTIENSEGVR